MTNQDVEMTDSTTLLRLLDNERIFYISKTDAGFMLTEGCDDYFSVNLSAEQLYKLGEEIMALSGYSHTQTDETRDNDVSKETHLTCISEANDRQGFEKFAGKGRYSPEEMAVGYVFFNAATAAAEAKYLPVIEKLVKALETIKTQHLSAMVMQGIAEQALAAPLLKGER